MNSLARVQRSVSMGEEAVAPIVISVSSRNSPVVADADADVTTSSFSSSSFSSFSSPSVSASVVEGTAACGSWYDHVFGAISAATGSNNASNSISGGLGSIFQTSDEFDLLGGASEGGSGNDEVDALLFLGSFDEEIAQEVKEQMLAGLLQQFSRSAVASATATAVAVVSASGSVNGAAGGASTQAVAGGAGQGGAGGPLQPARTHLQPILHTLIGFLQEGLGQLEAAAHSYAQGYLTDQHRVMQCVAKKFASAAISGTKTGANPNPIK